MPEKYFKEQYYNNNRNSMECQYNSMQYDQHSSIYLNNSMECNNNMECHTNSLKFDKGCNSEYI